MLGAEEASQPLSFAEGAKVTGLYVDIAEEIGRRTGDRVEIRLMPWARCLDLARSGGIDGIVGALKTEQRQEFLAYPGEPLMDMTVSLFSHRGVPLAWNGDYRALADARIGILASSAQAPAMSKAMADGTLKNIVPSYDYPSLARQLAGGRIAAAAVVRVPFLATLHNLGLEGEIEEMIPSLDTSPIYIAFSRAHDHAAAIGRFDKAMAEIRRDGFLNRALERYLGPGK